jgi:hypothetical protein
MFTGTTVVDTVMLSDLVAVCGVGAPESVTPAVKLKVPEVVGVPEILPDEAFKLNPVGMDPAVSFQAYGAVPPVAAKDVL